MQREGIEDREGRGREGRETETKLFKDAGIFGKNVRKTQRRNDADVQVEDAQEGIGEGE
jgi:hypothetical protein